MPKRYVENYTEIEASAVACKVMVLEGETHVMLENLTDASTLQAWDEESEEWVEVRWDFSIEPAQLYYLD